MPCLRTKKTVSPTLDFVSAIPSAAILQSMKIITHDSRVSCPALSRRGQIVGAIQKANPLAGFIDSRHADQFRTDTRHDHAEALIFASEDIQMATVTVFFDVRKLHRKGAS